MFDFEQLWAIRCTFDQTLKCEDPRFQMLVTIWRDGDFNVQFLAAVILFEISRDFEERAEVRLYVASSLLRIEDLNQINKLLLIECLQFFKTDDMIVFKSEHIEVLNHLRQTRISQLEKVTINGFLRRSLKHRKSD